MNFAQCNGGDKCGCISKPLLWARIRWLFVGLVTALLNVNKVKADVSVVVPCYNCSSTIERAVLSIAGQTLLPAEVILVDDCSKDETLSVLTELASKYPKDWIRIIALSENRGAGEARNVGWGAASQKYVAFLDADDAWHPKKIEIQYRWMEENPSVVLTGHEMVRERVGEALATLLCDDRSIQWYRVSKFNLLLRNHFSTPTIMVVRNIPHRFAPKKKYAEDYLLWLQIVCQGFLVVKMNLPLAFMYKAPYGERGLSGQLLNMQLGELDVYHSLRNQGFINSGAYLALVLWSLIRFSRRLVILGFRRVLRLASCAKCGGFGLNNQARTILARLIRRS